LEVEVESTDREYVDAKLDQYLNIGAPMEPPTAGGRADSRRQRSTSI